MLVNTAFNVNNPFPSPRNRSGSTLKAASEITITIEMRFKIMARFNLLLRIRKIHLQSSANDKEYNHVIIDLICILKDCSLRSIFYDPVTEASEIDYPMKNCVISGGVILSMGICLAGTEKFVGPVRNDKKWPSKWPSSGVKLFIWNRRLGSGRNCLNRELCPGMLDDNTKYKTEIKIYSLKNDKWRAVQGFQRDVIKGSAKFVKGKLYWTSFLSVQQHNTIIVATLFVLI
ncbi:hypothetical protein P3L10_002579 [Capsicum annuum]